MECLKVKIQEIYPRKRININTNPNTGIDRKQDLIKSLELDPLISKAEEVDEEKEFEQEILFGDFLVNSISKYWPFFIHYLNTLNS
jgi:hypothetical protein